MVERLVNSDANSKRIAYVEQCFGASGQPLAIPNRVLVGEGVLTKMCRKRPKQRQFFLFNDILVYGNIVISKKKYNSQHVLPLDYVSLQDANDDGNLRNGFLISSPSKSFVVYCDTATEKTDWMNHIGKCSKDLLGRRAKDSKVVTADPSPVWVPDAEAHICMHCKTVEFTLLNRRHHCRKCGIVCCNTCSENRWLLPYQSSRPLRVCLTCYNSLRTATINRAITDDSNHNVESSHDVESSGEELSDNSEEGVLEDNSSTDCDDGDQTKSQQYTNVTELNEVLHSQAGPPVPGPQDEALHDYCNGWKKFVDAYSNRHYFHNRQLGKSSWVLPRKTRKSKDGSMSSGEGGITRGESQSEATFYEAVDVRPS